MRVPAPKLTPHNTRNTHNAQVKAVFAAPTTLKSLKPLTAAYNAILSAYGLSTKSLAAKCK